MPRDWAYALDILNAARLALSYLEGVPEDAFMSDALLQDAVARRLEILGEAARRVSGEFRATHPSLPWREMIGMRNLMIHKYDDVDYAVVWQTVRRDLPRLIQMIETLLDQSDQTGPDSRT